MASYDDAIRRFVNYVTFGEKDPGARVVVPDVRNLESREYDNNPTIYSYGMHFPIVRFFRTGKRSGLFLLNGDNARGVGGWMRTSTPDHQDSARRWVADAIERGEKIGHRYQSIVIPFSALDGARIDQSSIRPIHVTKDGRETIAHSSMSILDVPSWMRTKTIWTRERMSRAAYDAHNAQPYYSRHRTNHLLRLPPSTVYTYDGAPLDAMRYDTLGNVYVNPIRSAYQRHACTWTLLPSDIVYVQRGREIPAIFPDANGRYHWTEDRHVLGESVFSAKTLDGGTRRTYLSGFDRNEPVPLYFLAMLPRDAKPGTVADAFESLKPAIVKQAIANGKDVKRQGDIFFIPTGLSDADVYSRTVKRSRRTVAFAGAKPRKGETGYVTIPETAERKIARLTKASDDAYNALAAYVAEVKAAYPDTRTYPENVMDRYSELRGASDRTGDALRREQSRYTTDRPATIAREIVRIYGTDHVATEVALTKSGAAYAKGIVYHERGNPDHMRLRLDSGVWYLAVRNTVPRSKSPRRTNRPNANR